LDQQPMDLCHQPLEQPSPLLLEQPVFLDQK
jgi:hypothetical protein